MLSHEGTCITFKEVGGVRFPGTRKQVEPIGTLISIQDASYTCRRIWSCGPGIGKQNKISQDFLSQQDTKLRGLCPLGSHAVKNPVMVNCQLLTWRNLESSRILTSECVHEGVSRALQLKAYLDTAPPLLLGCDRIKRNKGESELRIRIVFTLPDCRWNPVSRNAFPVMMGSILKLWAKTPFHL